MSAPKTRRKQAGVMSNTCARILAHLATLTPEERWRVTNRDLGLVAGVHHRNAARALRQLRALGAVEDTWTRKLPTVPTGRIPNVTEHGLALLAALPAPTVTADDGGRA